MIDKWLNHNTLLLPEECQMKLLSLFFITLMMISNLGHATNLNGWQGEFWIKYPTVNDSIGGPVSFSVGNDVEANISAGNIDFSLNISSEYILLNFNDGGCCTSNATFGGPVISFINPFENISSISLVDTDILNFTSANITFSNSEIFINIANGLDLSNNRTLQLLVSTSPVPEPQMLSLITVGFGLLGLVLRRKAGAS